MKINTFNLYVQNYLIDNLINTLFLLIEIR
jgi:hypothetical protein